MRVLFFAVLILSVSTVFATAPLESGFSQAPRASASIDEKAKIFLDVRNKVINAAARYEDTPYKYGGFDSNGIDCSGLIFASFKDALGISLPRSTTALYSWTEKISPDKLQPGDLLFFKTTNTGKITHVALYLGDNRFIHSASIGSRTGVIYSNMNEKYWSEAFIGAGRAFPEIPVAYQNNTASTVGNDNSAGKSADTVNTSFGNPADPDKFVKDTKGNLFLGLGIAPTWNAFLKDTDLFRGFASQLHIGAETSSLGPRMVFGLEIRPEYDAALGVFRLPITFSWGPSEKIMIFAGPVFSFGEAVITTADEIRYYSGGTSWLGAIGITAAPFMINSANGDFAPYLEAAWQSYFSDNPESNVNADFSAGFRFSTGVKWIIKL
jgi:hypothetical protein